MQRLHGNLISGLKRDFLSHDICKKPLEYLWKVHDCLIKTKKNVILRRPSTDDMFFRDSYSNQPVSL